METSVNVACTSAKDLLTRLAGHSADFEASYPGDWIFRGHGNADWHLLPSAFRRPDAFVHTPLWNPNWTEWSNRDQILAEAGTLQRFVDAADSGGLSLPVALADARAELNKPFDESSYIQAFESGDVQWPPATIAPVVALAQHYGLATRFLDWTRSARVAAYFAAIGVVEQPQEVTSLAVWAISLTSHALRRGLVPSEREQSPILIRAPYGSNQNLYAQEGVHLARAATRLTWSARAVRDDLSDQFEKLGEFGRRLGRPSLLKFVLARSEASSLLWYLAKEGVTATKIFPGFAGAAQSVLEARHWKRPY